MHAKGAAAAAAAAAAASTAASEAGRRNKAKLHQILEVMVAAGALAVVDDDPVSVPHGSLAAVKSEPDSQAPFASAAATPPSRPRLRRYAFLRGKPRADVILPSRLLTQIRDANEEIRRGKERIEFLRKELGGVVSSDEEEGMGASGANSTADEVTSIQHTSYEAQQRIQKKEEGGSKGGAERRRRKQPRTPVELTESARSVLHTILVRYPEVAYDPVYAAALRNAGVDSAAADRERDRMIIAAAMAGGGRDGINAAGGLAGALGVGPLPLLPGASAAAALMAAASSGLSASAVAAALASASGGGSGGGGSKRHSSSSSGKKRKKDGGGGGSEGKKRCKHHQSSKGKGESHLRVLKEGALARPGVAGSDSIAKKAEKTAAV